MHKSILLVYFLSAFPVFATSIFDNLTPTSSIPATASGGYFVSCSGAVTAFTDCETGTQLTNGLRKFNPALTCDDPQITSTVGGGTFISNNSSELIPRFTAWTSTSDGVSYSVNSYTFSCNNNTSSFPNGTNLTTIRDVWYAPEVSGDCPTGEVKHNDSCYNLVDIIQNDSCSINSPLLPSNGLNNANVCHTFSDGSKCAYEQVTINNQSYYQPSLEPSTCFEVDYPEYVNNVPAPSGLNCADIGNGVTACPDHPSNVCDSTGVCQSGCGTVVFDGTEQFMCFSSDTDGDGLGDYADPDIDGDGIANTLDLDSDGDGLDDPDYSNTPANNSPGQSFDSEALGQSIGQNLSESLTEQAEFSTNNVDAAISSTTSEFDTAVDSLLQDENFNLADNMASSDFNTSLDDLKNTLSPSTCTNTITIPFANQSLDICSTADIVRPILSFLFAFGTIYYCFVRIRSTAQGGVN